MDLLASSYTNQCQCFYTLKCLLLLGASRLNSFNHLLAYLVSFMFPPLNLVSLVLSKFLAECVTSLFRFLIIVACYWMEAPWLLTVLNNLADIPHQCPIIKNFMRDVLVGQVLKGLQSLHLTLWCPGWYCTDRCSLPQTWTGLEHHWCQLFYFCFFQNLIFIRLQIICSCLD